MRLILLFFLTIALPFGVYWSAGGRGDPLQAATRFNDEFWALGRKRPPTPEPEWEPKPKEEHQKEPQNETDKDPATPIAQPEPTPQPDRTPSPAERFAAGKFADAAQSHEDPQLRALARFGIALVEALPAWKDPYGTVRLRGGGSQEGFLRQAGIELTVLKASGSSMSYPKSVITGQETITTDEIVSKAHAANDARSLLRGAAICIRAGRPDGAAPLLRRIVEAKGTPEAIQKEIPKEQRAAIHRAYAAAAIAFQKREPAKTTVSRKNPLKKGKRSKPGKNSRLKVHDAQAREFMEKARPFRTEGERLFKKIQVDGLEKVDPNDIDEAIRKYEAAQNLYEKAWEREDSDAIYALVKGCSGRLFRLRFFRDQVGKR